MKLGIVIPYYKIAFFEETLKSLAQQTDKRFKVYVGDDSSPESPKKLLSNFKNKFDLQYHRFDDNLGSNSLTQQWERCISVVNEEWIMILGDDDILSETVVEEFYNSLPKLGDIKVVRLSSCKIDNQSKIISHTFFHPIIESSIDFLFRHERNSLTEYIFKREQINRIGFKNFHLAWCSDILGVLEFSNFGLVYSINNAIAYIRITALSISGNQENIKLKNLASEQFSKYIIFQKFRFFNKSQRLKIMYGYEVAIKRNRKLKFADWFVLFKLYFQNFQISSLIKFTRRFLINIISVKK